MSYSVRLALYSVLLMSFSFSPTARALTASEATAVQSLEMSLSDPETLERLEKAIQIVSETATPEEKVILDSLKEGVKEIKAEPASGARKQTKIGKLASKIGIGINRLVAKSLSPFVWGAGYLSGRYGKHHEFQETGDNAVLNFFGRLANRFKALGNDAIAALLERMSRGDHLTAAEVELIIEAMPELDVKDWEGVSAAVADGVSVGIALDVTGKVLAVPGLGALPGVAFTGFVVGFYGSLIPCLSDKAIQKNENLARYCEGIYTQYMTITVPARMKGYLRGIHDWNSSRGR